MEVTLLEILDAREKRVQRQKELLETYKKPLICFTMNIAGPEKVNDLISEGFAYGLTRLRSQLAGIPILHVEDRSAFTGCEAFFVADAAPERLKALVTEIEDTLPIGRLFDMDVLSTDGRKHSRKDLGLPQRTCLLCGKPAYLCSRSRAHSVPELQERTAQILKDTLSDVNAKKIAATAQKALLFEVCTTPKPGLVDCQNSGSHRDMDIFTFMASTAALGPYFESCAKTGMTEPDPEAAFCQLRFQGRLAEQEMFRATGGVNTHKGAIFTLGLLCAAAASLPKERRQPELILERCASLARGLTNRDFADLTEENARTAGQKLYIRHGITGIRGEAEAGFPTVLRTGLPVLEAGLQKGLSLNDAGCAAMLAILAAADDTNLIARSSRETQLRIKEEIRQLLQKEPFPSMETLKKLDKTFISANLSPGGSADLLAATYFLHFLKEA